MGSKRLKMDTQTASELECPVCFQIPRGKIFQCVNGHYICEACSAKVSICTECRSLGVRNRNLYAERLLDVFEFKCSYSEQGCDKNMLRGQLSAHEDQCDQNPDILKFCNTFHPENNCQYKFTSKWLSEPENCTYFINHVKTCLQHNGSTSHGGGTVILEGQGDSIIVGFARLLSQPDIAANKLFSFFVPLFYRIKLANQTKEQLVFLKVLLKGDGLHNANVSFALVQLTPETTPMVVKFTINGIPNSSVVSEWGQNSLPSQNWTQKITGFKRFMEMVATSQNGSQTGIPFPVSLPLTFLSEYFLSEDKRLLLHFRVETTA